MLDLLSFTEGRVVVLSIKWGEISAAISNLWAGTLVADSCLALALVSLLLAHPWASFMQTKGPYIAYRSRDLLFTEKVKHTI